MTHLFCGVLFVSHGLVVELRRLQHQLGLLWVLSLASLCVGEVWLMVLEDVRQVHEVS